MIYLHAKISGDFLSFSSFFSPFPPAFLYLLGLAFVCFRFGASRVQGIKRIGVSCDAVYAMGHESCSLSLSPNVVTLSDGHSYYCDFHSL